MIYLGCLSQILLGPFLNTLPHIIFQRFFKDLSYFFIVMNNKDFSFIIFISRYL